MNSLILLWSFHFTVAFFKERTLLREQCKVEVLVDIVVAGHEVSSQYVTIDTSLRSGLHFCERKRSIYIRKKSFKSNCKYLQQSHTHLEVFCDNIKIPIIINISVFLETVQRKIWMNISQ